MIRSPWALRTLIVLLFVAGGAVALSRIGSGARPTVVLITVDTLRPDHLGSHGYPRPTAPHLDRLAAEGALFPTVLAPRGQTWPTLASIMTSQYPVAHGVRKNGQFLDEGILSLAEVLKRHGYSCTALLSNAGKAAWPAFDRTVDLRDEDRRITDLAIEWIEANAGAPAFLWVHYFGPHRPFRPEPPWADVFDPGYRGPIDGSIPQMKRIVSRRIDLSSRDLNRMISLYDGEIRQFDELLGELLEAVRGSGRERETLVVLASDHGEDLYERNYYFSHSASIYDSSLRIPLVFRMPEIVPAGHTVPGITEAIDVAPTVLGLVGIDAPEDFSGRDRSVDVRGGAPRPGKQFAYSELEDRVVSVRTEEYRYVHNPSDFDFPLGETGAVYPIGVRELYAHENDPGERVDVSEARADVVADLERRVHAWQERHEWGAASRRHAERPIPESIRRDLEALGYVQ